jgi:glycosyltransferase involved in cell wall biosynthesis
VSSPLSFEHFPLSAQLDIVFNLKGKSLMSAAYSWLAHSADQARRVKGRAGPGPGPSQIRVLHSIGHLDRGGIENWVYNIATRLDKSRFEHHVLVRTKQEEPFTRQFREAGIRVIPCIGVTCPPLFLKNFMHLVRKNGPYDVLHAHGFSFLTTQALLLGKLAGIPLRIIHSHDDLRSTLTHSSLLYNWYARTSLNAIPKLANGALACGTQAAEWVFGTNWRGHPLRPRLIIGIDLEPCFQQPDEQLREKLGIPPDRFVILQVGRFERQKNHEFTVEIAQRLATKGFPFHFLLVGEGSLRVRIIEKLKSLGLAAHCTCIQSSNDVPLLMRSVADVALLPSLHEGLPLVHLESQAAGVPMLISDQVTREAALVPELLEFLPISQTSEVWADRIIARVTRPEDLTANAAHQIKFITSRFNIDNCAEELADIYQHGSRMDGRFTPGVEAI